MYYHCKRASNEANSTLFVHNYLNLSVAFTLKRIFGYSILIIYCTLSSLKTEAQKNSGENTFFKKYIDSLNEAADTLCLHKSENGKLLALKALELSTQYHYHKGIGEASHNLGLIYFRRQNGLALYYFFNAQAHFEKEEGTLEVMAFTLNNISRTYSELIQYDSSLYYAKKAILFSEQKIKNNQQQQKWIMFGLGAAANAFDGLSKIDSATNYLLRAVKIAEHLNNPKMLEVYYKLLSSIQSEIGNTYEAIEYLKKGIQFIDNDLRATTIAYATLASYFVKINDCINAKKYADSSISLGKECNVYNSIGRNYVTYGECKMKENKFSEALPIFHTGYLLAKKYSNSNSSLSKIELKIAETYEAMDSFAQAINYYSRALITERGNDYLISNTYYKMSLLSTKLGDHSSAYLFLKKYSEFKDTVFTKDKMKTVYDLTVQYETDKKERKLASLESEKILNQLKIEKQKSIITSAQSYEHEKELELKNLKLESDRSHAQFQLKEAELVHKETDLKNHIQERNLNQLTIVNQRNWILIILSSFLILSLVSLLLFNRYNYKKQIQNQIALTNLRQEISRDLHDDLGATLSGISMYTHLAQHQLGKLNFEKLNESIDTIQLGTAEMIEKVQDINWLVSPENDSFEKFTNYIHDMAERMTKAKQVQLESNISLQFPSHTLTPDRRKNIYLFYKEAINNALKYSQSSKIKVSIIQESNNIVFSVYDNGIGFLSEEIKKGNGLTNMKSRAKHMGGILTIHSKLSIGSEITLNLNS